MYIEIKRNYRCKQCGVIDNFEWVIRKNKTFIRCIACGHEKIYSTTTTNTPDDMKQIKYEAKKPEEFILF